jgi:hypothetical protein
MSPYELRAEHHPGEMARIGQRWHVVRRGRLMGLCGRLLSPVGDTNPLGAWAEVRQASRCPACWKVYQGHATAA